jgi:hypothetical protein
MGFWYDFCLISRFSHSLGKALAMLEGQGEYQVQNIFW